MRSIASLVETTRGGGLGGFVWTVLVIGALVAVGISRWNRTELPIHDRQTDVIVGTMGNAPSRYCCTPSCSPALRVVLPPVEARSVGHVGFLQSAPALRLFGLRPVSPHAWVWGILLFLVLLAAVRHHRLSPSVAASSNAGGR